jgi:CheY-like chemotaxis protein
MGAHILCVDDDHLIRRLVHDVLEQEGFKVSLATSGKQGLEIAHASPPDLILLDIMMPGMNGYEVCQALRQDAQLYKIPVVMLTAMESSNLDEDAFAAGAELCMTKPFRPDRLVNAMNVALQNAALKYGKGVKKPKAQGSQPS